ncbi:hypothetical protein HBI56_020690 [Parastagonospora nodorum]|uniref:Uncharacterized protein n=1 Tax=Phaeosphaeria nodorum (strain SN15 / ATCC MYA-4574 / FGSC 10173) TaxID=321614 RepID=A0A7U2I1L4_PHANO|nr:hypothetical protein HBH56_173660 [Parastagonospora nodorum]QRC96406.1 hypothetical protein JI435_408960 [Parastagonospora nodorum SN15]KAH3926476.1 hypothetical protein HBH54_169440 [Parastagonospora nodorum]KAH3982149.1 hypothetical protein HBH52_074900 [Parastagonospora nodorum]KAH4007838.1 hypothetical protein HBI10_007680 [Parastagonospora nodorum]
MARYMFPQLRTRNWSTVSLMAHTPVRVHSNKPAHQNSVYRLSMIFLKQDASSGRTSVPTTIHYVLPQADVYNTVYTTQKSSSMELMAAHVPTDSQGDEQGTACLEGKLSWHNTSLTFTLVNAHNAI